MILLLSGLAYAEPDHYFGDDHFYTRVAEIEVACNVPVNFEVRADDGMVVPARPHRAYPVVDTGDCSTNHLRQALQRSLNAAPCLYKVDVGHGGLVVAPARPTASGCEVAPSRLDEPLPVGLDKDTFWQTLEARGLALMQLSSNQWFIAPVEPVTMREILHQMMVRNSPDPRKPVYRVYQTEDRFGGFVHDAGTPVSDNKHPTGPFDSRTMWWHGDKSPRYRPSNLEETTAYFAMKSRHDDGEMSDEEWANYRASEMRSRLLNPRPDGKEWSDLDLILMKGSYDENGCLPDSTCALRHSGGSLP